MPRYRIEHRNSLDCDITETEQESRWIFDDETECGDKLREYIASYDIYPGDTLRIVEI